LKDNIAISFRRHIEEIVVVTDKEFEFVFSHLEYKTFKKHQFLIQKGNPVRYSYWIYKGLAKSYLTDDSGKEHILQFAMEGWWISDYSAHFNGTNSILDVDCLENTEVLCLSYANREKLCADLHKMEHFFRKKANSGFVALQKRLLNTFTNSARERYDQLLQQYPSLFQRVPKSFIASYLGVSRETLSRFAEEKK
jgi:CRP-like cAMP-binding protein